MVRRRVLVSGIVQGVFFRQSCVRVAHDEGVAGWVRNLDDGRVEAAFEGPADAVARLVDWCRHGPPQARVTHVEVIEEPLAGEVGFS
jgi:acylphosphatase